MSSWSCLPPLGPSIPSPRGWLWDTLNTVGRIIWPWILFGSHNLNFEYRTRNFELWSIFNQIHLDIHHFLFNIRHLIQMLDLAAPLDATVSKFEGHNSYVCYFSNKILYSTIPTVSRMGKSQPLRGDRVLAGLKALIFLALWYKSREKYVIRNS